jgi:hypothetical protein
VLVVFVAVPEAALAPASVVLVRPDVAAAVVSELADGSLEAELSLLVQALEASAHKKKSPKPRPAERVCIV